MFAITIRNASCLVGTSVLFCKLKNLCSYTAALNCNELNPRMIHSTKNVTESNLILLVSQEVHEKQGEVKKNKYEYCY